MNEISSQPGMYATAIWACAAVCAVVFALMLYSIATFRRDPAQSTRGTTAEVLWAIVPIAVVIAMAAPAVRTIIGADPMQHQETAQRAEPVAPTELASKAPENAFHAGGVPL